MDEIKSFMIEYVEGFDRDPSITAAYYAQPAFYVGPTGVKVMQKKEDTVAFIAEILSQIRPMGYVRTTVEYCSVKMLHDSIALCGMLGIRRRVDGSEIQRIGTTYVLTANPEWKIRELIVTDPGKLT
jgi:hypothetical protein